MRFNAGDESQQQRAPNPLQSSSSKIVGFSERTLVNRLRV